MDAAGTVPLRRVRRKQRQAPAVAGVNARGAAPAWGDDSAQAPLHIAMLAPPPTATGPPGL